MFRKRFRFYQWWASGLLRALPFAGLDSFHGLGERSGLGMEAQGPSLIPRTYVKTQSKAELVWRLEFVIPVLGQWKQELPGLSSLSSLISELQASARDPGSK